MPLCIGNDLLLFFLCAAALALALAAVVAVLGLALLVYAGATLLDATFGIVDFGASVLRFYRWILNRFGIRLARA